jgi:hypothetical protein
VYLALICSKNFILSCFAKFFGEISQILFRDETEKVYFGETIDVKQRPRK